MQVILTAQDIPGEQYLIIFLSTYLSLIIFLSTYLSMYKLTTGSKSFSLGTSSQVISTAPGVPGEQGVNRSCSIILGSALDGPNKFKTLVFFQK